MTMMKTLLLSIAIVSTACGKKDGDKSSALAKAVATKLPKLSLQIDVPGDVTVGDAIMGEGNALSGSGVGSMQVEIFKDPQTLDQAKDDAKMYTPNNEKADTLPDGWALTYENKGAAGTNYWVTVRRDIAGKSYKCWTTGSAKEQADAVLASCKTLRQ